MEPGSSSMADFHFWQPHHHPRLTAASFLQRLAALKMILRTLLIFGLLSPVGAATKGTYRFTLDGQRIHPTIYPVQGKRMGAPAAGDVTKVQDFSLVLREPGHYFFRSDPDRKLLHARINEGPEHCVALHLRGGESLPEDLQKQSAPLWGLILESRTLQETPPSLIDPRRTFVACTGSISPAGFDLAAQLHYFSFRSLPGPQHRPAPVLPHLGQARFLDLELQSDDSLSVLPISKATKLVNLSIKGGSLAETGSLASNRNLRFLKLRSLRGVSSLEFTRQLPDLRVLKVDETEIRDPAPLASCRELRLLSLNATPVSTLPPLEALPALRDLRLHSTPLSKKKATIRPLRSKMNILIKNWDPSIRAFEEADRKSPPPPNPVLFVGSSSIRMWDLTSSFPGQPVLNRGFGGSELSDAIRYFDRIILPYRPRLLLLYEGDNDIGNGETPEQVVADYRRFAQLVRTKLPDTHFAFLPIKPSLKRWNLWPQMTRANEAIHELCAEDNYLHFLDTVTPMLGEDGKPMPALFEEDGLHLNPAGYRTWNNVVSSWLEEHAPGS